MTKTIRAIFDGEFLRPEEPLPLQPNTRVHITVETAPPPGLRRLPPRKQPRLTLLMRKNNDGRISKAERAELKKLVHEAEKITLTNARSLASRRR